jgi:hypothetical protein
MADAMAAVVEDAPLAQIHVGADVLEAVIRLLHKSILRRDSI